MSVCVWEIGWGRLSVGIYVCIEEGTCQTIWFILLSLLDRTHTLSCVYLVRVGYNII